MRRIFATAAFIAILSALSGTVLAQSGSRDQLLTQIETKRAELAVLEKQILEPAEEDRVAYTGFLREPDTGLIRLLPREKYDDQAYRGTTKSGVTIRGGGAYYSFTKLSHDYNSGAPDLSLESGKLMVGFAGANYGMLTSLGDVPIEQITLDHPTAHFMAEYVTPNEEPDARSEARQFSQGLTIGGSLYASRVPAKAGTTYLLRSINYIASDVLVALRIVRRDTDGSVIIVWKLLRKYPTPRLAANN
jgi:hypothetical protein